MRGVKAQVRMAGCRRMLSSECLEPYIVIIALCLLRTLRSTCLSTLLMATVHQYIFLGFGCVVDIYLRYRNTIYLDKIMV